MLLDNYYNIINGRCEVVSGDYYTSKIIPFSSIKNTNGDTVNEFLISSTYVASTQDDARIYGIYRWNSAAVLGEPGLAWSKRTNNDTFYESKIEVDVIYDPNNSPINKDDYEVFGTSIGTNFIVTLASPGNAPRNIIVQNNTIPALSMTIYFNKIAIYFTYKVSGSNISNRSLIAEFKFDTISLTRGKSKTFSFINGNLEE